MAGFNPLAALLQGRALPQAPRVGAPAGPANRGGVYQPGGAGVTPFQQPAGVNIAQGINDLVQGFVTNKENEKRAAGERVQQALQLKAQGLPVDEKKLAKDLKRSEIGQFLNWDTPQPQPNAPTQGPPQQIPGYQMSVGPSSMPIDMPAQTIQPQAQPLPPDAMGPMKQSFLSKIGQGLGLTSGPIAENSQGSQATRALLTSAGEQGQMSRQQAQIKAQGQMQEEMLKQQITAAGILSFGVDPRTGKPVDKSVQAAAVTFLDRFNQSMKGTGMGIDGGDISVIMHKAGEARGRPLTDEESQPYINQWVVRQTGGDKYINALTSAASEFIKAGVNPDIAYREAKNLMAGKPLSNLPKFSHARMGEFIKQKLELVKEYPNVDPQVWRHVDGFLLSGEPGLAMSLLNSSPTKTQGDEKRANYQANLQGINTNIRQAELGVSQTNAQTSRMNANENVSNNAYTRSMSTIKELMALATANGKTPLQGEQLRNAYKLVQQISPTFRIQPGAKGWLSDDNPALLPRAGFQGYEQMGMEPPPGFGAWLTDSFFPAIDRAFGPQPQQAPSVRPFDADTVIDSLRRSDEIKRKFNAPNTTNPSAPVQWKQR